MSRSFLAALRGATTIWGTVTALTACADRPAPTFAAPPASSAISSASAVTEPPPLLEKKAIDESPFKLVATVAGTLDVYPEGSRVFVTTQGRMVGEIRGDAYVNRPELAVRPPFLPPRNAAALVGVSAGQGETLYAAWSFAEGRTGATMLIKWDGQSWHDLHVRSVNASGLADPVRWTRGRVLALQTPALGGIGLRADIVWVDGPKRDLPKVPGSRRASAGCKAWFLAGDMVAMPTGELWVLGSTCPATVGSQADRAVPVVQRYAEDGKDLGLTKLPFPAKNLDGTPFVPAPAADLSYTVDVRVVWSEGNEARLRVSERGEGPDRAWIVRFDGQGFTADVVAANAREGRADSPKGAFETRRARSADQTTEEDQLWHIRVGEPPRQITLPKGPDGRPVHVDRFWTRGADDLWLVTTVPNETRFYRTKANAPALVGLPAIDESELAPAKPTRAGPLMKTCRTVFVLLYTLAKTAPKDFDFPATRAALKGRGDLEASLSFIEFERGGQRFFGAHATTADVGHAVAKLVKEKVPGSNPAVVCDDPEPLRKLSIDLTSGKMR